MVDSDFAGLPTAIDHTETGPAQHHVEVHAVDADTGIVLDAQIDVFLDAEAKVSVVGEAVIPELVLTYLQRKRWK